MVTKKNKNIELKNNENSSLESKAKILASENEELIGANDKLKKDNKDLKNLVDAIRFKMAVDMKKLMKYEDSEIRNALVKWFKSTQG